MNDKDWSEWFGMTQEIDRSQLKGALSFFGTTLTIVVFVVGSAITWAITKRIGPDTVLWPLVGSLAVSGLATWLAVWLPNRSRASVSKRSGVRQPKFTAYVEREPVVATAPIVAGGMLLVHPSSLADSLFARPTHDPS